MAQMKTVTPPGNYAATDCLICGKRIGYDGYIQFVWTGTNLPLTSQDGTRYGLVHDKCAEAKR